MLLRNVLVAVLLLLCAARPCVCQQGAFLNGTWLLTGTWNPLHKDGPRVTLTMGAVGENLFGTGDFQVLGCGSTFTNARGKMAPDGTWAVRSLGIEISGTLPADGSSTWNGYYKASFGNGCPEASGSFSATRIESVHGTYSGLLKDTRTGADASVVFQFTTSELLAKALPQNANERSLPPGEEWYYTPVVGTVSIDGLHGLRNAECRMTERPENRMGGDLFLVGCPLSDGSRLLVSGLLRDSTASNVWFFVTLFRVGAPAQSAVGTLLRQ